MKARNLNVGSFRFESLEPRRVLNAAPVLLQQFPNSDWRAASSTDKVRSPTIRWQSLELDSVAMAEANTLAVADFTADGVDDVLMQWPDGSMQLQINDGLRLFQFPWGDGPATTAELLEVVDANNDGLEDLVSFDRSTGDIWVSLNSMDGFVSEVWSNFVTSADWLQMFVDDFNGDGRVDVLGAEAGGNFWLAKNVGDTFHNHAWGRFSTFDFQDIVSGDFSGDGLPDVAARATDDTWWTWEGSPNGMQRPSYWGHWKMEDAWHDVQVADFDGDLRDDIMGRTEDGRLWVGSAKTDRFHTWKWGSGWSHAANWTDVRVMDVNGDNLPDQLGRAQDNTWWYAENLGGRFANRFLAKHAGPTKVSTNFVRPDAIDLQDTFSQIVDNLQPGQSRHGGAFSAQSNPSSGLFVTTNDDGQLVLQANDRTIIGVEFLSQSGSLIPAAESAPFGFLLANNREQITYGSIQDFLTLNGSVVLDARWDFSTGETDLSARWGGPGDGDPISADVDDRLDGGLSQEQINDFGSENLRLYLGWNLLKEAATD